MFRTHRAAAFTTMIRKQYLVAVALAGVCCGYASNVSRSSIHRAKTDTCSPLAGYVCRSSTVMST